jgi:hypothetical protein
MTTGTTSREMMTKRAKPVLNPVKPKRRSRSSDDFPFDTMKPGDSFHYGPSRNSAIVAFVYRLASGFYKTEKDGDGWRFRLLKKLPKD